MPTPHNLPPPEKPNVTGNASDPRKVRDAERLEKLRAERFTNALAKVMATIDGRIVLAELLDRARVFERGWARDASIHYNAGRQDVGHELMASMVDVDEDLFQMMQREGSLWRRQFNEMVAAAHTRRATESEER